MKKCLRKEILGPSWGQPGSDRLGLGGAARIGVEFSRLGWALLWLGSARPRPARPSPAQPSSARPSRCQEEPKWLPAARCIIHYKNCCFYSKEAQNYGGEKITLVGGSGGVWGHLHHDGPFCGRLGSVLLCSARFGSARLAPARPGSARLSSSRLGLAFSRACKLFFGKFTEAPPPCFGHSHVTHCLDTVRLRLDDPVFLQHNLESGGLHANDRP